jgi:amino acid adenylation domain-containing protein
VTTLQFLTQLGRRGIRLWVEGDALRFSAPPRALTDEMRGEIAARKGDVMAFLRQAGSAPAAPRAPLGRVPRSGALPLSFAQRRLWFLDQLEPGSAFYNIAAARRLRGPLAPDILGRALGEVVRRHEALRTVFPGGEGDEPSQVVLPPPGGVPLPLTDLSAAPPDEREAALRRLAHDDAHRPFDLAAGPLIRASLVRLAPGDHALLLCMHHVISDGWSMGVLFGELGTLYAAFAGGEPSPLPELPVQYADFAAWQREHLRGEALDAQLAYWKERLAGAPALLELPTDRPRPAVQGHRGALLAGAYGPELRNGLNALARREGATLYIVLLAAFQVLLSRYSRQDDVVVGSPIAGRTRAEVEGLIGFFVNTLALRADLSGDPPFGAHLARVRDEVMGAYERQDVPFEKLVEELRPERSMSHSPVFQVMFVLQNAGEGDLRIDGVAVSPLEAEGRVAKFDLTLAVEETEAGLQVWAEYDTDLFDASTLWRMLGHYRVLLEGAAASPEAPVSALPLLTAAERALLEGWNRTGAPYPRDKVVHQLFEEQAARTPLATAVVYGDHEVSYAALEARADRLARRLVRMGVRPGTPVGLCLERTPELVAAMLAVLKAGGAYLPLDPAYPADRLEFMLRDAAAPVVVTQAGLAGGVPPFGGRLLLVDEEDGEAEDGGGPRAWTHPAGLAYLIYTSGSTGRPKGVQIEHRNAVAFLDWAAGVFAEEVLAGVLASTSVSFDLSVFEIFLPLSRGGCVVLADNALQLPALPARGRVTLVNTVPSAGAELVRTGAIPGSVRVVNLAGEALPRELADALYARSAACAVYNLYGPSEDTTYSTFARVPERDLRPPSIGRPISNTRVFLLDARMSPVPVGVPGELYLAGEGLARGYLGRPGLTAERFVPDPFSPAPGGRLYRTGDLARWTEEGSIDYLGRIDHQVKVRGFRIELGEIECVLAAHPGVREAVVLAREDVPGDRRLVAYVLRGGAPAEAAALREHVRGVLPEYMVPAAVVPLDEFPRTPNGKLDRKALPAPEWGGSEAAYVAPRTPVEEVLAGIWCEVLGVQRVGARDNFFGLGGHSLVATRVVSRVRRLLGVELPLRALFASPTVEALAAEVERARTGGAAGLPPVRPVPREGPLPLSFAQRRLWFLDQLEPGSAFYNIPAGLRLSGALGVPALERALAEVVRRHEALRTVFSVGAGGEPAQGVLPAPESVALPVHDLRALPAEEREPALGRLAREDAHRAFDLARGPLFRASLVRLADDDHALLLCMHHVVSDAWSVGVLFHELSALYGAFVRGEPSPLSPLPVQYADWAAWQHRHLGGGVMDAQLAYWKERLAGAPALLELPTDRPRPPVQSYRGASLSALYPAEMRDALRGLARGEGATPYMVLLAAFQLLLARYSRQEDVVVGSPIAGRTRVEVEELIGFFVNTLVLRTPLEGSPSFRELVGRVREVTLGAYAHQDVPFEKVVEELRPSRSLSHTAIFQVLFQLQNQVWADLAFPGVQVSALPAVADTAKFDLSLAMAESDEGLRVWLAYNTDLFDASTAGRLLDHFRVLLQAAAARPGDAAARLPLLSPEERARLVQGPRAVQAAPPAPVHQLFEQWADRAPDGPAVVHAGGTVSYARLEARANRLAHRLRALGVGPETRVGVCVEHGPELLAALLGILKAGGAYVPLDPAYPEDRLAFVIGDARLPVVLTQERLRGGIPTGGAEVVCLDGGALDGDDPGRPRAAVHPDGVAYVIYTSGSTGRPKGVEVPHASLANLVLSQARTYGMRPGDRQLVFASIGFDASVAELCLGVCTGAALHTAAPERLMPGPGLLALMRERAITCAKFPPTALAAMEPEPVPSLRLLLLGGEGWGPELGERWAAEGRRIYNVYGPTEATIRATTGEWGPGLPVRLGAPVDNVRVYVLDGLMEPVPVGVPGELFVGGRGVARGYLGRPALTAERFVPDPFSHAPGARLYRTGDLVRARAEGELEFLGRLDHQVKVRGFRIEPGEIESVLSAHPAVRDVVVLAREDAPGDRRLVAYVVPREGGVDAAALRGHARESLPDYMVPAAVVSLDDFPRTPNGKLDRRALPAPEWGGGEAYAAPRTPVEEVLAGIWGEVLGVERVGARDSFFDLGGHSLMATRVISRVRGVLGVEVPLRALFADPTVQGLAREVERVRRGGGAAALLPPVAPAPRDVPPPLSFAQRRLWFLDQLEPGSAFYNIPSARRLRGPLDVEALEAGLGEVVRRHEALRTVFRPGEGGDPVQVILPAHEAFSLRAVDLRDRPAGEREVALARLAREDAEAPFDLARGPLFRASLVRLDEGDHALLLCMHHIVSDGWSTALLHRELGALYAAFRRGLPSPLPALPVQYADYAVWQHRHLRGEALDSQVAFWKGRLAGAPTLLELPTDRPRPAVQSHRGGVAAAVFPAGLHDALAALARREGATLYMVLLAAFQVLLARYSRQDDVVVGSPIAGRTRAEVEGLVGFFVNTLAFRTGLGGDPAFGALLARVRDEVLEGYAHQDVPFERLVEELRPERSMSHSPLFQVMFALQNAAGGELRLEGVEAEEVEGGAWMAKFDLTLAMAGDGGEGLRVWLGYAADLFEPATIERMLGHFRVLLEGVAATPESPISALPLLGPDERAALLQAWSPAGAPSYPAAGSLHGRFRAQAARTPSAAALSFESATLSYAELDAWSERLARRLARLGVGPEARVGICVERGPEMVAGLLAILKAGGAYVPLDPAYPADRLAYVMDDAAIRVLLAGPGLAAALPVPDGLAVVPLDGAEEEGGGGDLPRGGGAGAENAAYVIYTSGSTGRPKGVQVTHGSVLRLMDATHPWFGFGPDDAWTLFHSYAFDFSVWEMWGALLYGGRLVVVPFLVSRSPEDFYRLLVRERVTVLNQTPSAFRQLAAAEEVVGQAPDLALRTVVFGGEALEPASLRGWVRRHGYDAPRLVNMYGITETTVHVTYRPITPADVERGSRSPVGVPIPDLRVYVLDGRMEPCPAGVPGEMLVGGPGVARGYLGRPALTAQRFVPDPYGPPGARLYRSGDGARWLASGELEYLGRLDQQVKVRGFRIEPGEIEGVLAAHPAVRQAVVVVREDAPGDRRLVAYVVSPEEVGAAELREHARTRLPDYMVPAAFVRLDALPLTPNGKLDARALPAPGPAGGGDAWAAPRTPAEEVLAGIWAEVLGVERVGVRDSFFDLGGHSLLATRVMSRVRAQLGAEVPLRALFAGPTVEALAREVERARGAGAAPLPPVQPVPRDGPLPLSFAQRRLWFLDQYEQDTALYNIPAALRLAGPLDAAALERALGEVVCRHEALRTVFRAAGGGEPVQVILPAPRPYVLPVADLRGLAPGAREAELERRARDDARRPFDLATGPVFRAELVRLGEEDHALLLCMHHVASDGWSMGVLYRELGDAYGAFAGGRPSPLPALPVQYADYAAWQHRHLRGEVLDGELGYWRGRLAGAPTLLELPSDRPRPPVQDFRGAVATAAYPPDLARALAALARDEGATLYMVLLAALQLLLSRYSRQNDVVVGSPVAGRTRAELEGLIGFFLNTLVLRTDLSGAPTFRELLARVREGTLDAYAHQQVPFEKLVEELRPERSLAHTPLFQVMFILQNNAGGELRLGGVRARALRNPGGAARYDLTLAMAEGPDGLGAWLEYSTALFDAATANRILEHLGVLLRAAADRPGERASRLPLLPPEERARLLEAGRGPAMACPPSALAHRMFAEQAARTPGAVALSFGERSVTYAQLDAASEALAGRLRAAGVAPGVLVGICLERGPEMVAGLLGILRAGGAYVPLDPGYPTERLAFMLHDSAAPVLLTQAHLRDALPFAGRVLLVEDASGDEPAEVPARAPSAGDLAYVIYTSGSTGRPKGVQVPHGALANFLLSMRREPGMGPAGRLLAVTTLSFDIAALELYLPLAAGATVRLASRDDAADGARLREELERGGITAMQATPATWRMLVDAGWAGTPGLTVLCGGEALDRELRDQLLARAGQVWNVYGPTETTIWSTLGRAGAGRSAADIGRPIANTSVHVLDPEGEPVPPGVPGELLIGGEGVARGYLGRPGLTAERFVPGPVGGRVYRTGDLVRRRPDGALEFIGRVDHQVKVRGFRIELGEVESVLATHPGVRQAVALVREDVPGDRRLVAYVVAEGEEATPAGLREHARRHLPEYMVPSAWVLLERLPLTPNGKVDRRALPAPGAAAPADAYVAPRTPAEGALAAAFAELLGAERVGIRDDFFELGGHSLLAVRLMARVERETGRRLPLNALFRHPTVERLARHLDEGGPARPASPLVAIQPHGTRPPFFCVHAIDGHVLSYAALARELGADQPFHALQARGAEGEAQPSSSIPEMAGRYVDAVRAARPSGPYRLGGWSLGGVVAYEMARILRAAGERVDALVLVDVPRAVPEGEVGDDVLLAHVLAHVLGGALPDGWDAEAFRALAPGERLARVRDAAVAAGSVEADFGVERLESLIRVRRSHMFALQRYVPAGYDGPAWLIHAASAGGAAGRELPWEQLVRGPLTRRSVPGNHFSILQPPGVRQLARHVAECLRGPAPSAG